jgi:hypothetical protein
LSRAGGRSYYVRGHLVNHHLSGSGETWANLTPLTQGANNGEEGSMERQFERPVKQAVLERGQTVRNFEVTAVTGQDSRGADLTAIDQAIAASAGNAPRQEELRVVRRVVDAEQYIPASVNLRADVLAPDGSALPPIERTVRNTIEPDWTRYAVRTG